LKCESNKENRTVNDVFKWQKFKQGNIKKVNTSFMFYCFNFRLLDASFTLLSLSSYIRLLHSSFYFCQKSIERSIFNRCKRRHKKLRSGRIKKSFYLFIYFNFEKNNFEYYIPIDYTDQHKNIRIRLVTFDNFLVARSSFQIAPLRYNFKKFAVKVKKKTIFMYFAIL